jgi:hypothetical protein
MPTRHERIHFSQRSYGESILLLVEFQLFQNNDVAGLFIPSAEDNAIGTFLYLVEPFV